MARATRTPRAGTLLTSIFPSWPTGCQIWRQLCTHFEGSSSGDRSPPYHLGSMARGCN
jgi:hypothetical protein